MYKVIDTPWSTEKHAAGLKAAGVEAVIRYYNHNNSTNLPQKRLEAPELKALLQAGLSVATCFQQRGGKDGHIEDLTAVSGKKDATRALQLAQALGQPKGSAIYFAVDHDYVSTSDLKSIRDYFSAVRTELKGKYRVGAYASGAICKLLRGDGSIDLIWLPAANGWLGTKDMLKTDQWALYQHFPASSTNGLSYDGNTVGGKWKDFGQFHSSMGAVAAAPDVGASTSLLAALSPYSELAEVAAGGGLNLRRGPGESFAIERLVVNGTLVTIRGRSGDWAKVDVNGDGTIDGYMHAGFLRAVAGGLPIPSVVGSAAYAIAKAELALGVAEVPGSGNNPRIVMYHNSTNHWSGTDDSVAWCSSFVNYCVEQSGHVGTNRQDARSWLKWGNDVTAKPAEGDIVVFARGTGPDDGHVGFYVEDAGTHIKVLGGNQSDSVRYQNYPKNGNLGSTHYKLLSIRRG